VIAERAKPAGVVGTEEELPDREPFNPMEGEEAARQLVESASEFLNRVPTTGSEHLGPWLWVANPYAERDQMPEARDPEFMQRLNRLLVEYLAKKNCIAESDPDMAAAMVTRKLKPDRDYLKEQILEKAKDNRLTSGKVSFTLLKGLLNSTFSQDLTSHPHLTYR
jgi:hypothetical protein